MFVGLNKSVEIIQKFCVNSTNFGHISKLENEKFVEQIKEMKVDDPMIYRRYVVDVDSAILKIFEIQENIFKGYRILFEAVDINRDEAINFYEFFTILRNIEKKHLNDKEILDIFQKESDLYDHETNEQFLSFRKFANICLKKNLCSLIRYETFIRKSIDDIKNFDQLKILIDLKINIIKLKLMKTNNYSKFYRYLIELVIDKCKSKRESEKEKSLTFLRYRILDEESSFFLTLEETKKFLPKEFLHILNFSKNKSIFKD